MTNIDTQVLSKQLASDNPAIRSGALAGLFEIAPDIELGLENIAFCLNDAQEDIRVLAVETLGKCGEPSLSYLTDALNPEQPDRVRISAASCLGRMGKDAEPAVSALGECLISSNELLRWHAGFALAAIGRASLDELKQKLQAGNQAAVMAAAQALGWMKGKALETMKNVQAAGESVDMEVAASCAASLIQISGKTDKGLPVLLENLKDGKPQLRKLCIQEIGLLGDQAAEARDPLIACLADPDPEIRSETALALARIGCPSTQMVDALIPLISDEYKTVSLHTCIALSVCGTEASNALPDLELMAQNNDPQCSEVAREAIQTIQSDDPSEND